MEIAVLAENPDLWSDVGALVAGPEFIFHDPVSAECWHRLAEDFPDFQVALLDGGRVAARGASIPLHWEGSDGDLPEEGWDFVLRQGVADLDAGRKPTTSCALWIVVAKDFLGRGLSARVVEGLRDCAAANGFRTLYAPVRPTKKAEYPLIPMTDYVTWTLDDGVTPFDPWLRVHWRAGGQLLHVCSRSMVIPGSIVEWEGWTGMPMPVSGQYVVPGALNPVHVDHEADSAVYVEPNVWVRHTTN